MSEVFKNSYFFRLPNEVLIKILSDVDTISQLNFCEVYGCDYFLQNRNIIQIIDLQKEYVFHDLYQFSRKINPEHVTTLNINGLYWIKPLELRRFISKLVNLETLYTIQSSLSLTRADVKVYSKMKIKKLAVSVIGIGDDDLHLSKLPSVETLYISVEFWSILDNSLLIEEVFPNVLKIWINVGEDNSSADFLDAIFPDTKLKIYVQVDMLLPINLHPYGLTTFYANWRPFRRYTVCWERFDDIKKPPTCDKFDPVSWQVLKKLRCKKPYGPIDARRLYLNGNRLEGIFFEELNFFHHDAICNKRFRDAVREILISENAHRLRKLCIMPCLLRDGPNYIQNSNDSTRKRRRIETSKLQDIFNNLPQLEELAIFECTKFYRTSHSVIQRLSLISSFENLQSLRIDIPIESDGSFVPAIFLKCKRLQVFKIFSRWQNDKLDFSICSSVHNATSLKDLVYENDGIHLDKLLEQLAFIKSQKLQRILLKCSEGSNLNENILKKFMEANPQLVFLYFAISNLTVAAQRMAQKIMKSYQKKHPAKAFFVEKNKQVFKKSKYYPMLQVHSSEIMTSKNSIATLNPLEDFQSF